jgi:hypothetical protein
MTLVDEATAAEEMKELHPSQAAGARLAGLNKQAQARDEEQRSIAPNGHEIPAQEEQRSIAPSADEIQAQVALLESYKVGVTSLDDFYWDNWNASDPFLTKLGIVHARYDQSNKTVEFDIAYYGDYETRIAAGSAVEIASYLQAQFQQTRSMAGVVTGASEFRPSLYDTRGISLGVDARYPEYHLTFIGGELASITKK